jgi:hypothetical protein
METPVMETVILLCTLFAGALAYCDDLIDTDTHEQMRRARPVDEHSLDDIPMYPAYPTPPAGRREPHPWPTPPRPRRTFEDFIPHG